MSKGGKRNNSGRKKIGMVINIRVEDDIVYRIDNEFEGKSRAEKIRACLKKGLDTTNGKNKI
ncbi:hypothetical protein [Clostridium sp.]|uniref:hypothetical protein n=1 Tax=Clostridium sp. TaxID=1506 RepID=UPI0025BD1DBE|nr:hypothetical protein [Clostridium sp.]